MLAIKSDIFAKSELCIWALIFLADKMQKEISVIKYTESIEIKTNQLLRELHGYILPRLLSIMKVFT